MPICGPQTITPQPVRAGFPCFGAALVGYVEATIGGIDEDKRRHVPPRPSRLDQHRRAQPGPHPPDSPPTPELAGALQRLHAHEQPGMTRMAELAGIAWPPRTLAARP